MTHFSWWIDGSTVGLYLLVTLIAGVIVRKYVGKVEHFLVAGREVNVYLGIASLAATEFGVVTCMYSAQLGYNHGFAGAIPGIIQAVAMFLIGITGFCVKPLRDAGVMTIPELFEKRYGPRIRWAAGVVIVLGGLLNMGVFLRVTGEFLVLVCGFNMQYLELMMTVILVIAAVYTILGGMLSVLVTDFLQFVVMSFGLLAVTILILWQVGWDTLVGTIGSNYQAGGFNPFVNAKLGWPFVVFNGCVNVAATLTWQTTISRLLAAKDAKTGRQIYTRTSFFFVCRFLIPAVWGVAALAMVAPAMYLSTGAMWSLQGKGELVLKVERDSVLPVPEEGSTDKKTVKKTVEKTVKIDLRNSAAAKANMDNPGTKPVADGLGIDAITQKGALTINSIAPDSVAAGSELRAGDRIVTINEMEPSRLGMPLFLSTFVPIGLMGLLVAAMLAADMSTTSSYMITWGSVIYNDVMAPFRKTKWSEKRGILWNRMIVALIGIFLLVFGLWYPLRGDVWDYLAVTGTVYLASVCTMLIACCYWKRANSWGAAGAIIVGAAIPLTYLALQFVPGVGPWIKANWGANGLHLSGIAAFVAAGMAMVIGSLLKPAQNQHNVATNQVAGGE